MIYRVTVRSDGRLLDSATFPVGKWKEIAYWLDDRGYIEKGYVITVEIGNVNDFVG